MGSEQINIYRFRLRMAVMSLCMCAVSSSCVVEPGDLDASDANSDVVDSGVLDSMQADSGSVDATADASSACDPIVDEGEPRSIQWVTVPAGSFVMGCSPNDNACYDCESPTHTVNIASFEMTATEITQDQYEQESGENPSRFAPCANCPVEEVTWEAAVAFCASIDGRLPSEAEWEYAARGGTTTAYSCGDDENCLDSVAWYRDNACNQTHLVARKSANGFGLYDMQGNVWEWVQDCWHDDYNGEPPSDGSVWPEGDCNYRVLRGGAFGVNAQGLRVSNRDGDYVDGYLIPAPGLRCVRNLN